MAECQVSPKGTQGNVRSQGDIAGILHSMLHFGKWQLMLMKAYSLYQNLHLNLQVRNTPKVLPRNF